MTKESTQNIQLIEGNFNASEAADVVISLLDKKINFHKLQRLAMCEGHDQADTNLPDDRITELQYEKKIARDFISIARNEGRNLKIDGVIKISFAD